MANSTTQEPLETQLWKAADKLRKNIDAAEYKHVVLGLTFLKYISDYFEALHFRLIAEKHLNNLALTPKTMTITAPKTSSSCRRCPHQALPRQHQYRLDHQGDCAGQTQDHRETHTASS